MSKYQITGNPNDMNEQERNADTQAMIAAYDATERTEIKKVSAFSYAYQYTPEYN